MARLEQQHVVIMGKPKNRVGERGLVSTLEDINQLKTVELRNARASLAFGAWVRAKPDWDFELCKVPKNRDFASGTEYREALDALYHA